jgi:hypothetical protein
MDQDIEEELGRQVEVEVGQADSAGGAAPDLSVASARPAAPARSSKPRKCCGPNLERHQKHEARMAMKLQQKHLRDDDGAASLRIKPGAKISEKQWARLDDTLRERVVKAGGLPPYKVERKKKQRAKQQGQLQGQRQGQGGGARPQEVLPGAAPVAC